MAGFVQRLVLWLERAAAGHLDAPGELNPCTPRSPTPAATPGWSWSAPTLRAPTATCRGSAPVCSAGYGDRPDPDRTTRRPTTL